jgi:hypothetical protein
VSFIRRSSVTRCLLRFFLSGRKAIQFHFDDFRDLIVGYGEE